MKEVVIGTLLIVTGLLLIVDDLLDKFMPKDIPDIEEE